MHPNIYIDVRLIGFENDGNLGINIQTQDLSRFLQAISRNKFTAQNIINTDNEAHSLLFGAAHTYRVVKEKSSLETKLHEAVAMQVKMAAEVAFETSPLEIDVRVVDDILSSHYSFSGMTYTIYLLNLLPPIINTPTGEKQATYVYTSESGGCPMVHWVGTSRYAWVDLTA